MLFRGREFMCSARLSKVIGSLSRRLKRCRGVFKTEFEPGAAWGLEVLVGSNSKALWTSLTRLSAKYIVGGLPLRSRFSRLFFAFLFGWAMGLSKLSNSLWCCWRKPAGAEPLLRSIFYRINTKEVRAQKTNWRLIDKLKYSKPLSRNYIPAKVVCLRDDRTQFLSSRSEKHATQL